MSYPNLFKEGFSVIIPSWDRLDYLKATIYSIQAWSAFDHEIIVHVNGSTDGTQEFLTSNDIKFTESEHNLGVAEAVNCAAKEATKEVLFFTDNDILMLPGWDSALATFALDNNAKHNWWINSLMIEPNGNNPCCIAPHSYGTHPSLFDEERLLKDIPKFLGRESVVSTYMPAVLSKKAWESLGGANTDLKAMGAGWDDELAFRYWHKLVCRNYPTAPESLCYHFQAGMSGARPNPMGSEAGKTRDSFFKDTYEVKPEVFMNDVIKRGSKWIAR